MIIYRPHRGSLSDALKETKEFETEDEMKEYIYNYHFALHKSLGYKTPPFEIDDICIGINFMDDKRCGWHDSRYVSVKRYGNEDYLKLYGCPQCIGTCATNYEK